MRVRRIGVLSMATTQALIMTGITFLFMLVYALILGVVFGLGAVAASGSDSGDAPLVQLAGFGIGMVILAVVMVPLLYGAIGFIIGALTAVIYNFAAKWTGGIKLDLQNEPSRFAPLPPGHQNTLQQP